MQAGDRVRFIAAASEADDIEHYKGNGEELNVGTVGRLEADEGFADGYWVPVCSDDPTDWAVVHESRLELLNGPTTLVNHREG